MPYFVRWDPRKIENELVTGQMSYTTINNGTPYTATNTLTVPPCL